MRPGTITALRVSLLAAFTALVLATYPAGPDMLGFLFVLAGCAMVATFSADWINEARRRDW